jgi:hypothetical protein
MTALVDPLALDPLVHVSGLGTNLHLLTAAQRGTVRELEDALALHEGPEYAANRDYVDDAVLVRHLIARDWDVPKALKMVVGALQWRMKRPSHRWRLARSTRGPARYAVDPAFTAGLRESGSTGKIRCTGTDAHGRPVMVFDNSRENATDPEGMMEHLAFNMELAKRTARLAGKNADKMFLLMHLADFSLFNQPPMSVTKETITVVGLAFPEFLGCCVILNPPLYFTTFWKLVQGFIDPKTRNKIHFLSGDLGPGGSAAATLERLAGPQWQALTGAGMPVVASCYSAKHKKAVESSPGFDVEAYWPTVLDREQRFADIEREALDRAEANAEKERGHGRAPDAVAATLAPLAVPPSTLVAATPTKRRWFLTGRSPRPAVPSTPPSVPRPASLAAAAAPSSKQLQPAPFTAPADGNSGQGQGQGKDRSGSRRKDRPSRSPPPLPSQMSQSPPPPRQKGSSSGGGGGSGGGGCGIRSGWVDAGSLALGPVAFAWLCGGPGAWGTADALVWEPLRRMVATGMSAAIPPRLAGLGDGLGVAEGRPPTTLAESVAESGAAALELAAVLFALLLITTHAAEVAASATVASGGHRRPTLLAVLGQLLALAALLTVAAAAAGWQSPAAATAGGLGPWLAGCSAAAKQWGPAFVGANAVALAARHFALGP